MSLIFLRNILTCRTEFTRKHVLSFFLIPVWVFIVSTNVFLNIHQAYQPTSNDYVFLSLKFLVIFFKFEDVMEAIPKTLNCYEGLIYLAPQHCLLL